MNQYNAAGVFMAFVTFVSLTNVVFKGARAEKVAGLIAVPLNMWITYLLFHAAP